MSKIAVKLSKFLALVFKLCADLTLLEFVQSNVKVMDLCGFLFNTCVFFKGEIPPAFDRCWTTPYAAPEQHTATGLLY